LDEDERIIQMHGDTIIISEGTTVEITLVTFGGIGELVASGTIMVGGDNEKQTLEKISTGEPGMGISPLLSVRPATLGKVAPIITDLITIYDSDVEEIYIAVPVTNEEITEVLRTQVS
jgi:hypothetical protein